ncbi:MAG TPA: hypothetical protein VHB77_08610 [Planctomycetaceae bacterium]|nr:hypothetical protein [Planctomycetaceae bacterium]
MSRSGLFSLCLVLLTLAVVSANPEPSASNVPRKILEERVAAARAIYEQNLFRYRGGETIPSDLFEWSENWLEAELPLAETPADRVRILQNHLDRSRVVEKIAKAYFTTGQGRQSDAMAATYFRLGAEVRLFEAGATPHPEEGKRGE